MTKFLDLIRDLAFAFVFQLAPRLANVILFILLGRAVGAEEAGVFTLAATYLLIMSAIMFGMDDLLTRQVAREPSLAFRYLTNFTLLRLGLTVIIYAGFVLIVNVLFDYSPETNAVILIMGLSLIPDSLAYVAQSVLLGQRFFLGPTIIITAVSALKLAAGIVVVSAQGSLIQIAWIWFYASLISMFCMWILALYRTERERPMSLVDTALISRYWRTAFLFIFITALATLETQFDTVILSWFHGESTVAWFGAATTIAYGLILLSHAYRFAAYPLLSRYAVTSQEKLARLYENSLLLMSFIIFPIVAAVAILAPQIVGLIFGSNFDETVPVLQILIFALIFIFLNEPSIRILLVHNRQRTLAIFLLAAATTNIVFNLILAGIFGAEGAAVSRIASSMMFFFLTFQFVKRKIIDVDLFRIAVKPIAAATFMSIILLLVANWPLPIIIPIGFLFYLLMLKMIKGWPTFPWEELTMGAEDLAEPDSSAETASP